MSEHPAGGRRQMPSNELVARLWDDVRRAAEEPFVSIIPESDEVEALVYDPNLAWLNSAGAGTSESQEHLLALINTMAERHDRLVVEIGLLRQAVRADTEAMTERAATLHRLLESRIEAISHSDGEE